MRSIDDEVKKLTREIRTLQKIRLDLKKRVQQYCSHQHIVREAKLPRFSYRLSSMDSPTALTTTIKVKTYCKDCGKVFK